MHFDHYNDPWWVGFMEADWKTSIHLIARHRNFCSHFKFNEALRVVSSWGIPFRSNLILINQSRI